MKLVGKVVAAVAVLAAVGALLAHEAPRLTRIGR